jgi:hypothetical protein
MAFSSARCGVRQVAVSVYPGGIKAHDVERHVIFSDRRGRPVKKTCFMESLGVMS